MSRQDVIVVGAGIAGLTAAIRAGASPGTRVLVLAKGAGATHLSPLHDRRPGLRAGARRAPARGARAASWPPTRTTRTPALGAARCGEALDVVRGPHGRRVSATPAALEAQHAAADGGRRAAPDGAGARDAWRPATCARRRPTVLVVGLRPLKDFHPRCSPTTCRAPAVPTRGSRRGRSRARGPRRRQHAGARTRARRPRRVPRPRSPRAGGPARGRRAGRVPGRARAARRPRRPGATCRSALGAARRSRSRPCRPRVPGMRVRRAPDRGAARGRRARDPRARGRRRASATLAASRRARAAPGRANSELPRRRRGARDRRLRGGRRSSSTRTGGRARPSLGLPRQRPCPGGRTALRARATSTSSRMARAGVAVDAGLRPVGRRRGRGATNVSSPARSLAGAVPWREKSGEGISLATGYRAAGVIVGASAAGRGGPHERDRRATTSWAD